MVSKILLFLGSWLLFFVVDMFWIRTIMGGFYKTEMNQFFRFNMQPIHQTVGIFVWFLLVLGLFYFVLPMSTSLSSALLGGLIFGLVVYGVYDLTNFVVINHWSLKLLLVDLVWGCFINSAMAGVIYLLNR